MGGHSSKLDATNWNTANGGLTKDDETIDGAAPTSAATTVTLTKMPKVTERSYQVTSGLNTLLYETTGIEKTANWFELVDKNGMPLLRVTKPGWFSKKWLILAHTPIWESQDKDQQASDKASRPLYRKAEIIFNQDWNQNDCVVYNFIQGTDKQGIMNTKGVLRAEAIQGRSARFQTVLPDNHDAMVGYWEWDNTQTQHKMEMKLAAGTDVALHVILAVVANIVYTEHKCSIGGVGGAIGAGVI